MADKNNELELKIDGEAVIFVRKDSIEPIVEVSEKDFYTIGKRWFIQTVTYAYHGTLIGVSDKELLLSGVAWIADCGRLHNFMMDPKKNVSEVEPFKKTSKVVINRGALIMALEMNEVDMFKDQK